MLALCRAVEHYHIHANFGSPNYMIAFLGKPSKTTPWIVGPGKDRKFPAKREGVPVSASGLAG